MADDGITSTSIMNNTLRAVLALIALLFFSGMIVYLILYGKSENSLHQSALGWAFVGDLGVLAALGFGAIANILPGMKK